MELNLYSKTVGEHYCTILIKQMPTRKYLE